MKLTLDAAKIALQKAELDLYDVLAGQGFAAKDTLSVPANILAMAKMRSGYTSARNSLDRARLEYDGAVRVCDHDNSEPCIPQICTSHR